MTKEDQIAEAVTSAAKAEAEKDQAEAERATSEAAATAVAASNNATVIAKEEAAIASQRAAADIQKNQEENSWLREAVSNLHKNSETLAATQVETMKELASLKETTTGIVTALTRVKSTRSREQEQPEVNPEKETAKNEAEKRAGKNQSEPEVKKSPRRWI